MADWKMELKEYKPSALLSSSVAGYRVIESGEGVVNRVLPGTSIAVAFSFRGKVSHVTKESNTPLPKSMLSGLRKSVRLIGYAPGTSTLVVLFKPGGAAMFTRQPLNELFEESVSLDNFFSRSEVSTVESLLMEANDDQARVEIVDRFLCSKIIGQVPDRLVQEAVARIYGSNGMIRIAQLSDELSMSQDAFEKRFRRVTGSTAKQFSMIVRMKSIVQGPAPASFLDIAIQNGYFDQAHFNKAFKTYTGLTPSEFFKSASFW